MDHLPKRAEEIANFLGRDDSLNAKDAEVLAKVAKEIPVLRANLSVLCV